MKFTVIFITLCISASWAIKVKKTEEPKDKREASVGYPSTGHATHSYQAPALGHEDASAISIGAGYSVGGAKPSFSYGGTPDLSSLQSSSDGLQSSGHATIQLAPITLQPTHGLASSDLSQLMSQLSHSLNTGALSLSPYQSGGHGGQEFSLSQYPFPKLQQYSLSEQPAASVPSYAVGTKGLGQYGSNGPVLFNPSDSHASQASLAFVAPNSGHSYGDAGALAYGSAGHSLAGLSLGNGHSLGDSGHTQAASGLSLGGSAHLLGGSGYSQGDSGHSLGGAGHSLGAAGLSGLSLGGSYKNLAGSYVVPSKGSFKPSQFIGSTSHHGDSGHGLSSLSGSYGAPSFGSSFSGDHGALALGSGGHGVNYGGPHGGFGGGSSKFVSSAYLPAKAEAFGSSLESVASFASGGHLASPSYGGPSSATHAASSHTPQYYVMSSKYPTSGGFGAGSSSYRAPVSGHGSVNSFSSGPKHYSFGGHSSPSGRYGAAKDSHGAHSETTYNTIKYSEELKPRPH